MIEKLWYSRKSIVWLLLPFTLLFWFVSFIRRVLYRIHVLSSSHPDVPVIVVGNISVGGNGKTPVVMYLYELLTNAGYQPGVLSRGYGATQTEFPLLLNETVSADQVGDEPLLIYKRLGCPIVIDPTRKRGAELLKQQNVNVIICDDGLQHYALQRDIELIVIDGDRRFGNGFLLPMGPLREGLWRLNTVDFVIANGEASADEYAMTLNPSSFINVLDKSLSLSAGDEEIAQPTALAGIGNPQRFFDTLSALGIQCMKTIAFPDHHKFSADDIPKGTVLMTEKDSVKCADVAHKDCWYLPVNAKLSASFDENFLAKLQQVEKNYGGRP